MDTNTNTNMNVGMDMNTNTNMNAGMDMNTNMGMEENHPDQTGQTNHRRKSISVFFPCHNEADNVAAIVEKARGVLESLTDDYEIIIVDDGSTDGTDKLADEMAEKFEKVKAIHHETNLGYGAALQSGFRAANKELVFYTDGDSQFDIAELADIIDMAEQYDIVSCFRLNRQDNLLRRFNARCWTGLICLLFGLKLRDIDCAFKLFKREIFDNIEMKSTGALIDAEILARAVRKGYTIAQKGVHHYPRETGKSSGANPAVIFRAFGELIKLRKNILAKSGKR